VEGGDFLEQKDTGKKQKGGKETGGKTNQRVKRTDKQTDKQTNKQTNRQTNKHRPIPVGSFPYIVFGGGGSRAFCISRVASLVSAFCFFFWPRAFQEWPFGHMAMERVGYYYVKTRSSLSLSLSCNNNYCWSSSLFFKKKSPNLAPVRQSTPAASTQN
jgi:hypothetical protein